MMPEPGYSLHPKVLDDIADIVCFIARDDLDAAFRVEAEIYSTFDLIALPRLGVGSLWQTDISLLQGIRFVPLTRYKGRYLVFWMAHEVKPRILYVFQANRDINRSMSNDLRQ